MQHGLTYLATPYSHPDAAVRQARFDAVNGVAASMVADGQHVFSPIGHSHPMALVADLPTEWEYWSEFDSLMLSICTRLVVLCLDGWRESVGVRHEIEIAEAMGIPVEFITE
jgi:hypothetical protein